MKRQIFKAYSFRTQTKRARTLTCVARTSSSGFVEGRRCCFTSLLSSLLIFIPRNILSGDFIFRPLSLVPNPQNRAQILKLFRSKAAISPRLQLERQEEDPLSQRKKKPSSFAIPTRRKWVLEWQIARRGLQDSIVYSFSCSGSSQNKTEVDAILSKIFLTVKTGSIV